jgi:hypothetical protein
MTDPAAGAREEDVDLIAKAIWEGSYCDGWSWAEIMKFAEHEKIAGERRPSQEWAIGCVESSRQKARSALAALPTREAERERDEARALSADKEVSIASVAYVEGHSAGRAEALREIRDRMSAIGREHNGNTGWSILGQWLDTLMRSPPAPGASEGEKTP